MGVETWVLLATVAVLAWIYSKWRHSYWASRGVPSLPATPFLGHIFKSIFTAKKPWKFQDELRNKFDDARMCGFYEFFKPTLLVWDTEILKHIFVKDFDYFVDHRHFDMKTVHERDLVMMEMLSAVNGAQWKSLRAIMSPAFTSGKIKSMFHLVCDKADILVKISVKQAAQNPHVDMKKNFGRFTMDTIASCAFGIESNSLMDENAEFPRKAQAFFEMSSLRLAKFIAFGVVPRLLKALHVSINPPELDFFVDVVKHTVAAREAGKTRGDFLDLLLEARDNSDNPNSKLVLSQRSLIAQSVLFIIAGYETTASLLDFSSFLLAKHKNQQQRLREEVRQLVKKYGGITYHGIMEGKLLKACLQETLRLYPPALFMERYCTKAYKLPGTDLTIRPGDIVQAPIWALHHDPRHWPDPEAFIPDRFLPENKGNINSFAHMPFGMGPRNCLAMRFALMEAKVALAKLLLGAELELAPGHEEVTLDEQGAFLRSKDLNIKVKPIMEE
ncbi:cytochrome P450 3A41-like isoform X1 [Scylla paramamosain]|uniref:cytochrome P450 3A41-like isoform X1 n=1 Tax=Scylla paramamosain TaxID=85552 RepID=UPI0030833979